MASYQSSFFSLLLFFLFPLTFSKITSPPNALLLPITKHPSTLQYVTTINQRTPLVPIKIVIDLGGPYLWVSCDPSTYYSSTHKLPHCRSPLCSLAMPIVSKPHCSTNNTCILFSENAFTSKVSAADLSLDVLSIQSTDGLNPRAIVSARRSIFLCAPDFLVEGLASGAKGIAGLGHGPIALPTQLATAFNFSRIFAICLSPSTNSNGVIFFGDGPYVFFPGIDISKLLIYTPLVIMPRRMASRSSHEYNIRVKSVRVNGQKIPLNSSLLLINNKGMGGTMISTINPYTTLETSIYSSLTNIFIQEAIAANATRVTATAPFRHCFSIKTTNGELSRPAMPVIDLVLQDDKVFWRIFETNAMVPVGDDIACLGFLDGGLNPRSSIVIGGYQLEDNFLQFDLVSSRLGFTSSLLLRETSCSDFNFTSNV